MASKKNKTPAKKGRPAALKKINDKLDDLFAWIADGKTIRQFCIEQKISRTQVQERLKSKDLSEHLARARAVGALQLEDEILKIADEKTDKKDPDDMQRRKIRIAARAQRLVWNNPAKYGTKTVIEAKITHKLELSDHDREIRGKQLLAKAYVPEKIVEAEIVQITDTEPKEQDE